MVYHPLSIQNNNYIYILYILIKKDLTKLISFTHALIKKILFII